MTNKKFSEKSEDVEHLHRFLFRIAFNLYRKNTGVGDKTANFALKDETPSLIPTNEKQTDDLESNDVS